MVDSQAAHGERGQRDRQQHGDVQAALHVGDEQVGRALVAVRLAQREEEHQRHDGGHQQHDAEEHAALRVRQIDGQVQRRAPRHRARACVRGAMLSCACEKGESHFDPPTKAYVPRRYVHFEGWPNADTPLLPRTTLMCFSRGPGEGSLTRECRVALAALLGLAGGGWRGWRGRGGAGPGVHHVVVRVRHVGVAAARAQVHPTAHPAGAAVVL